MQPEDGLPEVEESIIDEMKYCHQGAYFSQAHAHNV